MESAFGLRNDKAGLLPRRLGVSGGLGASAVEPVGVLGDSISLSLSLEERPSCSGGSESTSIIAELALLMELSALLGESR